MRSMKVVMVIVLSIAMGIFSFAICPQEDLNNDCDVDIEDMALFAQQWLNDDCTAHVNDCANFNYLGNINFKDYAVFSEKWQNRTAPFIISEFLAVNTNNLEDEEHDTPDWIEILNVSGYSFSLNRWHLTDSKGNLNKWQFPDKELAPDESIIVFASSKDRRDPESELHTNFTLRGDGEYLALVRPDGTTVVQEFDEFPQQYSDISYGIVGAKSTVSGVFIPEFTPATALIPTDGSLGETWTGAGFDDSSWLTGSTGVGYDYSGLVNLDVSAMQNVNGSVYVRIAFNISQNVNVTELMLQMKYDDGFVAHLNGDYVASSDNVPENPDWNSVATPKHPDADAQIFVDYDITQYKDKLQLGQNVLAIQGLNSPASSSDLLILPKLTMIYEDESAQWAEGYFMAPTPGADNSATVSNLGPMVRNVTKNPSRPEQDEPVIITADVTETQDPVDNVKLNYRVMYGSNTQITMYDDGAHGDGDAGDNIYGATIPASIANPGEMIRWYVTAEDNNNITTRNPMFPYPTDSAEYYGTVVIDPCVSSSLPIIEWFVQDVSASERDSGTRGSVYYDGEFYDNIFIHRRGGSTAGKPKTHFKFNFNHGEKFRYDDDFGRVNEFNLNSTFSDKSYVRQFLSFEVFDLTGTPGCISFPMRGQRNAAFMGVYAFIEEPEEELLEREGLDPRGALYKMGGNLSSTGGEKKTRKWEAGKADMSVLVNAIDPGTEVWKNYIFDNINIPMTLNFLTASVILQHNDDTQKNYYLYRDSEGTGEWFYMPWDLDLTFGSHWMTANSSFHDGIWADLDYYNYGGGYIKPSHPKCGTSVTKENRGWNHLTDALLRTPEFYEMYQRRMRTIMDQMLQAPGTDYNDLYFENRLDEFWILLNDDVILDRAKWGHYGGTQQTLQQAMDIMKNDYLDVRRDHLYITHNVDNAGSYTSQPGDPDPFSAEIPNAQPGSATVDFNSYDYNPSSGNQDQEYIALYNSNTYAVDISGWYLTGGVEHDFIAGTVIRSGSSLYVTPSSVAFRARTTSPTGGEGLLVQQSYKGHLSSWGETVYLYDKAGTLIDTLTYSGSPSSQQQYIRISEIMYHPESGGSYNEEEYEFIELTNIGTFSVSLNGLKFTNGIYYDFTASWPGNSLAAGQSVIVVKNQTAFDERYNTSGMTIADGNYSGYLSNSGEEIKLEDSTNSTVLEFDFKDSWYSLTDGDGFSLVIVDANNSDLDSWDKKASWRPSYLKQGSPSATDAVPLALPGDVVINEVLTHTDLADGDWIELHNTTGSSVNISGWYLSDKSSDYKKYVVGPGDSRATIPAGGYVVFTATADFQNDSSPSSLDTFGLSEHGEQVYLTSGSGGVITGGFQTKQDFYASRKEKTFSRYTKSALSGYDVDFVVTEPSRGAANNNPIVGPVVITEILYNSPELDSVAEYIELKNVSGSAVQLYDPYNPDNHWAFTNGVDYDFPGLTITLAVDEVILITRDDPNAFRARYASRYDIAHDIRIFGPYDGKLDNAGEKLELSMPGEPEPDDSFSYYRVDYVNYKDALPWPKTADGQGDALHRDDNSEYGNDVANWIADEPSLGL